MRPHTSRAFEAELVRLKDKILRMGGLVEQSIGRAMKALVDRDASLAEQVIKDDHRVNRYEVEVDEMCVEILAIRQPAAEDLRLIITGLKISTDLERIGDLAVNMAERALNYLESEPLKPLIDLPRMAELAQGMLRDSLDAYVSRDAEKAREVCRRDDAVDQLNHQVFRELIGYMIEDPKSISRALALLMISRYLERIADHATNLSEMVIYLVQGKDIRHMSWEGEEPEPSGQAE